MSDKAVRLDVTLASPAEQVFPKLTPAQIARIAVHGRVRPVQSGDVLVEAGDQGVPFFVVTSGPVEVVRPSVTGETIIRGSRPGGFTGEANLLSGRPVVVRARVRESGEVIELDRERMRTLFRPTPS